MAEEIVYPTVPPSNGSTGSTVIVPKESGAIVCGQPSGVVAMDDWSDGGRLLVEGVEGLWSMDSSSDSVLWVARIPSAAPIVGQIDWKGAEDATEIPTPIEGGDLFTACLQPGTTRFYIPQMTTLEVYEGVSTNFVASIELGGRPHGLHCAEDALYVGVEGTRERGPEYSGTDEKAFWIARVPYDSTAAR